ncbi:MAG: phosphoglycolate phosphatase [Janthinobacterium lividum]
MRRTLLLDLDGTLVDSVPDLLSSINRMMAARGLAGFTAPEVTAMVGDGAAALVGTVMAARGLGASAADVDAFIADYTAHASAETRPYAGVPETLGRLREDGWRLGVCTNKPVEAARRLLEALGLAGQFAAIGGGDSYPMRKPHPGHLLHLIAAMGATPDDAIMVGDHHNDVLAAAGAGLPCIFAAWGYGPMKMSEGAAAVAQRVTDLPELLARL